MQSTIQAENKTLVQEAFETLFNRRDYAAPEHFWAPDYVQHSAHIPPGRAGLFDLIKSLPCTLKHEVGTIMAEGDLVIVHGRYSGAGVFVEHWDVIQDEATREQSKSGAPMFGLTFPATG